jgi:hypothetical protein
MYPRRSPACCSSKARARAQSQSPEPEPEPRARARASACQSQLHQVGTGTHRRMGPKAKAFMLCHKKRKGQGRWQLLRPDTHTIVTVTDTVANTDTKSPPASHGSRQFLYELTVPTVLCCADCTVITLSSPTMALGCFWAMQL